MKYLILLSGKMRSGKNQYAEFLETEFINKGLSVSHDYYAKDLKDYSVQDFKILGDVLTQKVEALRAEIGMFFDMHNKGAINVQESIQKKLDELLFKPTNFYEDKTDITRALLQIYGTDIARKRFDDEFWVKRMAERINNDNKSDVIIVTDVRFPNELEGIHNYIKTRRIIPIRIERNIDRHNIAKEHESEIALDDYKFFEYVVDNNGTLENLKDSSKTMVDEIVLN